MPSASPVVAGAPDLAALDSEDLAQYMMHNLVGRRTGIVRRIVRVPRTPDGPQFFEVGCELVSPASAESRLDLVCGGAGRTQSAAVVRCLGEAVERYCAGFRCHDELPAGTPNDLTISAVDMSRQVLFSDAQYAQPRFPFARMRPDLPLRRVEATSLRDGSRRAVPACLVHLPYVPSAPEPPVVPAISTGLACGTSFQSAALAGLLEVVERDALTCVWLARLSPPSIPSGKLFPDPGLLPHGSTCRAYEITSDIGIPAVLVVLRGRTRVGPVACIGTAAGLTRWAAARKALREAAMSWTYATWLRESNPDWEPGERFENVRQFADHARLYAGRPELHAAFEFLESGGQQAPPLARRSSFTSPKEALAACVERVNAAGYEAMAVNLTTADVRGLGLHVVRALCPGLQPLNGSYHLRFLGPGRLWHVRDHFPFATEDPAPGTLNPYPHPSA